MLERPAAHGRAAPGHCRQVSQAVLYGKILQGIPLVGVLGGAEDAVLLGRIQRYAAIKYERRFLIRRRLAQLK